jgi:hypothetical protein
MRPRFRLTPLQIHWLLTIAFSTVGYALYLRYMAIEQPTVAGACEGGLKTWLCWSRHIAMVLFNESFFGWVALGAAVLNLLRPTFPLVCISLAAAGLGLVLYNTDMSAVAVTLLILSLARLAPASARQ